MPRGTAQLVDAPEQVWASEGQPKGPGGKRGMLPARLYGRRFSAPTSVMAHNIGTVAALLGIGWEA